MKNQQSIKFTAVLFALFCFMVSEVSVFAQNNIAKDKATKQSSTAYNGASSRAVDGNTDGNYRNNSVTHTDDRNDRNQWWEVDLGQSYNIGSIKIHNRTDCCADRLKDIYILVSENPIKTSSWQDQPLSAYYGYNEDYKPGIVEHKKNAKGRYVRIFRQAGAPLSLAEVEIFEGKAAPPTPTFSGWYRLKTMFQGENKCLEGNQATSEYHGGNAFMDNCQNVSGQLWKFEDAGNGYYRLKTQFRGEGECLEGNQATSKHHGGNAFMDKCQNVSGQLWKVEDAGNGYYRLKTMFRGEGECLEGNAADSDYHGGNAFMDKCQNVSGQLWKIEKVETGRSSVGKPDNKVPTDRQPTTTPTTPQTNNTAKSINAFAWYDQPTSSSFTLSSAYQHNSMGGAITGTRTAQGQYSVIIPNMAKHYDGVFHVTAYGGNHSAQVVNWGKAGNDLKVNIRVFDANGAATDGRFSIMFQKETDADSNTAYLWASAEGTPNHAYKFNGNRSISMKKTGTGVYQVSFEGMQRNKSIEGNGGNVIATAYNGEPRRIEVVRWGAGNINIHTYDFNGQPADTRFVVSYNSTWDNQAAYVWGNDASKTTTYDASTMYQMNNVSDKANEVTRTGVGQYKVTLPGIKSSRASNAIATAYGGGKAYATITSWTGSGATNVIVNTFSPDGKPVDSRFSLFYTTDTPVK